MPVITRSGILLCCHHPPRNFTMLSSSAAEFYMPVITRSGILQCCHHPPRNFTMLSSSAEEFYMPVITRIGILQCRRHTRRNYRLAGKEQSFWSELEVWVFTKHRSVCACNGIGLPIIQNLMEIPSAVRKYTCRDRNHRRWPDQSSQVIMCNDVTSEMVPPHKFWGPVTLVSS
jgi:hypothetical protein